MQPKTIRIIYWITTIIYGLFSIIGIFFINNPEAAASTAHLGVPSWLALELTIGKAIGGIILIIPMISARVKEWAYVAFGIDCISAGIAIFAVDGAVPKILSPVIFFLLLLISYISFHKVYGSKMD